MQFAILHDGGTVEPWQQRCIDRLQALPDVTMSTTIDLSKAAGAAYAGALRARGLDFILCFATTPVAPELHDVARYGLWRFQFGDWARSRWAPVGFWEVYEAHPTTCASLVRQTSRPNEVIVLRQGHLRTNLLSARANRAQLLDRFTHWPAQVCIDIRNAVPDLFNATSLVGAGGERSRPTLFQRAVYGVRVATRIVRTVYRSLFRHEQWNIGIVDAPISSFLTSNNRERVRWFPPPPRHEFRADPFGIIRDGKLTVLCEQLSYRTGKGIIVAIDAGRADSFTPVAIGPRPEVHLSYPMLVELDGRTLCVPESCAAAEIGLYEAERFPDRWRKIALLAAGSGAIVDATLFRHEGRWWLAGSEDAPKGATCELHLWFADEITGPWTAHAGNPVKIDIRSARPGGTPFYDNGVLYRPAQDCSQVYGARIAINRVETLTPTEFREVPVALVEPDPAGPYTGGLHTLSAVGGVTLIDAKRLVFMAPEFRRVLLHFVRRARAAW